MAANLPPSSDEKPLANARGSVVALISIALLSGCNVGPRYNVPATPPPPAFKESSPAEYRAAPPGTWKPAEPQDAVLKGKWWEMFNEPELNALEDQLDINNQNIVQYFQNFMAARAQVSEARAGFFPTVTADPAITKSGGGGHGSSTAGAVSPASGAGTGTTTTGSSSTSSVTVTPANFNITLPIDVSWEPDLWGRIRNTVREYQFAAQVSAADLENERLTEQADLAEYYFQLRGQDALQDLYNRVIEADRQSLELTRALLETGIDNQVAVDEATVTLENAQEAATGIATNRAIYEHAIAMLIGQPASSFSMPIKNLTTPLPAIPVGVPSELLQRRPDIAAAERTMAQANAIIGVEKAAYYPTLSLTGSGGLQSSAIGKLFSLPALFWSLGASATETIFDAGLRKATMAQYTAQYNADVAAYKQTVLAAFQQVEDFIATLRVTSQQIERQQAAINSSERYVTHENSRYQTGLDPYLNVITAQLTLLSNQQTEVALRVNEMTAAVELVQALGGGWNVSQLPAASEIRSNETPRQVADTP
jgi:NodT family efflux transporter outer membrane factor (OMF) lipoprotein